jgi:hypothetical protein
MAVSGTVFDRRGTPEVMLHKLLSAGLYKDTRVRASRVVLQVELRETQRGS